MGLSAKDVARRTGFTEAAMAGDPDALVRLLEVTQPDIRRFARQQCRSWSDADDAVQETLWLLYRRVGTLRAAGALTNWLQTMVRRACLRLSRAAARHGAASAEDQAAERRFSTLPATELRIDVAAALGSLPVHYRAILLLRDVEELTIDEIGRALDLSREAAKGRLHRARAMVRDYLLD